MPVHPRPGEGEESVGPPASPQIDGVRMGKPVVELAFGRSAERDRHNPCRRCAAPPARLGGIGSAAGEAPTESRLPLR